MLATVSLLLASAEAFSPAARSDSRMPQSSMQGNFSPQTPVHILKPLSIPFDIDGKSAVLNLDVGEDAHVAAASFLSDFGYAENDELLAAVEQAIALRAALQSEGSTQEALQ